jgi:hypothetical protein
MAVPVRLQKWDAGKYLPEGYSFYETNEGNGLALSIVDPGCQACRNSFVNKLEAGFFSEYNVAVLPYVIRNSSSESGYMFHNSYIVASYIEATRGHKTGDMPMDWLIVKRIFTEYDEKNRQYQDAFNYSYNHEEAEERLQEWLRESGFSDEEVRRVAELAVSDTIRERIEKHRRMVEKDIKTKKIPTMIYGGKRRDGTFDK